MRRVRQKNIALLVALAQRGFTARKFAALAALNPATISAILNQRCDPKEETKKKIARALSLHVSDVFPIEADR